MTFLDYINLPGLVAQRLYQVADTNCDGLIDLVEFRKVMQKIYYSRLETKLQLVFDIYDFDNDGIIGRDEIQAVLNHVPLTQLNFKT